VVPKAFNGAIASECTQILTIRTTYGCGRGMWPKCQHRTYDAIFMYTKLTWLQMCTALSVSVASFWHCSFDIDKNFGNSYVSLLPEFSATSSTQIDLRAWHIGVLRAVSRGPNALNMHCLIRTFNCQTDQSYIRPRSSQAAPQSCYAWHASDQCKKGTSDL